MVGTRGVWMGVTPFWSISISSCLSLHAGSSPSALLPAMRCLLRLPRITQPTNLAADPPFFDAHARHCPRTKQPSAHRCHEKTKLGSPGVIHCADTLLLTPQCRDSVAIRWDMSRPSHRNVIAPP
ncbi:hypothetical protein Hypma_014242 [Hypsizygus marmoreus]|uniref:Uncharacterized protein n=1 Tax=Hypsizygus marmoreus TaxID=39966 RepID=A0A369JB77_HYPMA|nr:hypothetical protein Hypma_014242 [Hypsizygus marmoreus]